MRNLATLVGFLFYAQCFGQSLFIELDTNRTGVDDGLSIVLSNGTYDQYPTIQGYTDVFLGVGADTFFFQYSPQSLMPNASYQISTLDSQRVYTLYFTEYPIIKINCDTTIVDEPKRLAQFQYADREQILSSNIGIELRGGSSQGYPKKTYDLEFWQDSTGLLTRDVQFGNLYSDDDWILDALYNEPLRMRSFIANKLWNKIHQPHYSNRAPEAAAGADLMFVEVFLNRSYNGLYQLSEQVSRELLQLKKYNGNIRGELYKGTEWGGATTFDLLESYRNSRRFWSGYKYKYPSDIDTTNWQHLHGFKDFVINSTDREFKSEIWSRFSKENFIDYYLFLNLIRAVDNTGKNIYVAKYDKGEPYFYVPWDLDGCFGTGWDGSNDSISYNILSNNFMDRVIELDPKNTKEDMATAWFDYRHTVLSYDSLSTAFWQQYRYFFLNKIYERESLVYPNYSFGYVNIAYTLQWIHDRLAYLDYRFGEYLLNEADMYRIYPNPARYFINVSFVKDINGRAYNIYNSTGALAKKGSVFNEIIDVQDLRPGVYYLYINGIGLPFVKQ